MPILAHLVGHSVTFDGSGDELTQDTGAVDGEREILSSCSTTVQHLGHPLVQLPLDVGFDCAEGVLHSVEHRGVRREFVHLVVLEVHGALMVNGRVIHDDHAVEFLSNDG